MRSIRFSSLRARRIIVAVVAVPLLGAAGYTTLLTMSAEPEDLFTSPDTYTSRAKLDEAAQKDAPSHLDYVFSDKELADIKKKAHPYDCGMPVADQFNCGVIDLFMTDSRYRGYAPDGYMVNTTLTRGGTLAGMRFTKTVAKSASDLPSAPEGKPRVSLVGR